METIFLHKKESYPKQLGNNIVFIGFWNSITLGRG